MCGHANQRSFIICFKVQPIFLWVCANTPPRECTNSSLTFFQPVDWRSCTPGAPAWLLLTAVYVFTNCLLDKNVKIHRVIQWWCGTLKIWHSSGNIFPVTPGPSVRSGGWGNVREGHTANSSKKSINNVCCLHELWTRKGFYCLPLNMWLDKPPGERRESGTLTLDQNRYKAGCMEVDCLLTLFRDDFRGCQLFTAVCITSAHSCGFALCILYKQVHRPSSIVHCHFKLNESISPLTSCINLDMSVFLSLLSEFYWSDPLVCHWENNWYIDQ